MKFDPACFSKDTMTRTQAKTLARRMRRKKGSPIQAYKCQFCRRWHVGNRTNRLRPTRSNRDQPIGGKGK